jgi:hypothetical protein
MMVALSTRQDQYWETGAWGSFGLGIAGALALVSGAVAFVVLYPSDDVAASVE